MGANSFFSGVVDKSKENKVNKDDVHQNSTISSLTKNEKPVSRVNVLDKMSKTKTISKVDDNPYLDNIDPRECQIWHRQSRFFDLLDEKQCEDLISDFKGHIGQKIPIVIRKIQTGVRKENDDIRYEVIAGSRRLWSALYVQKQFKEQFRLKAIIKTLDDKQAAVECEKENEREDLSAFEKGMFYHRLLEQGVFDNQKQLSDTLNIPKTSLQELLEYGKIDNLIIKLFSDPREIKKSWSKSINQLCTNEVSKKAMIDKANGISHSNLKYSAQKIFNLLQSAGTTAVETSSPNKFEALTKEVKDQKSKRVVIKMERTRTNKIRISIDNKNSLNKKDILKSMEDFLSECEK